MIPRTESIIEIHTHIHACTHTHVYIRSGLGVKTQNKKNEEKVESSLRK